MEKKQLLLADVKGMSDEEVRSHIIKEFSIDESELDLYEVLIASQDEDSYEGQFYILLKNKENGNFFEVYGSHCSCMWYEAQFKPELAPIPYLLSEKHNPYFGRNEAVRTFLKEILGLKT